MSSLDPTQGGKVVPSSAGSSGSGGGGGGGGAATAVVTARAAEAAAAAAGGLYTPAAVLSPTHGYGEGVEVEALTAAPEDDVLVESTTRKSA